MKRALVLLVLPAAFACSSGSSSSSAGDASAPARATVATAALAPFSIAAGDDRTLCVVAPLDNAEDVLATRIAATLDQGIHHVIVYRATGAASSSTPTACTSFDGATTGASVPLFIADQPRFTFDFPDGVGVVLPAHAMVRIEGHYLNASSEALSPAATVTFEGTPVTRAGSFQAADFGVWGTKKISIPPNASASTGVLFQSGIAGTTIFAATTYQHALGTRVQVWSSSGAASAGSPILDDRSWWNPALAPLATTLPQDGSRGLSFQCDWLNTTPSAVGFGEAPSDEVCLVGVYYYPSHGVDVCMDGVCAGRM